MIGIFVAKYQIPIGMNKFVNRSPEFVALRMQVGSATTTEPKYDISKYKPLANLGGLWLPQLIM